MLPPVTITTEAHEVGFMVRAASGKGNDVMLLNAGHGTAQSAPPAIALIYAVTNGR
jgi:hypothetical protein